MIKKKKQLYFLVWNLGKRYELESISLNESVLGFVEVMGFLREEL